MFLRWKQPNRALLLVASSLFFIVASLSSITSVAFLHGRSLQFLHGRSLQPVSPLLDSRTLTGYEQIYSSLTLSPPATFDHSSIEKKIYLEVSNPALKSWPANLSTTSMFSFQSVSSLTTLGPTDPDIKKR
jgi:hypothetical protein